MKRISLFLSVILLVALLVSGIEVVRSTRTPIVLVLIAVAMIAVGVDLVRGVHALRAASPDRTERKCHQA
ncbi:hypothetical protein AB0L57_24620 [Nocardia sp. NPDC052254]|uniref:hypothetical protein n=1 Tax=Nocardia sp. NPDC052254 TaxID=3155681 RepID=UPI00341BABB5